MASDRDRRPRPPSGARFGVDGHELPAAAPPSAPSGGSEVSGVAGPGGSFGLGPLAALVEASPDAVLIAERGRCRYANPAACDVFGRSTRELCGLDVTTVFPDDAHDQVRESLAAAAGGGVGRGAAPILRLDREEREIEYVIVPFGASSKAGAVVIARDVTDARARATWKRSGKSPPGWRSAVRCRLR
jgi:PAS domain S-box-containing protein